MKNSEALVIVDMQPKFETANNPETIKNVCRLVARARLLDQPIIILEYDCYGPTHKDILDCLEGYPKVFCETKNYDDGSSQVFKTVREFLSDNPPENYVVCGVNIEFCVVETVCGLLTKEQYPIKKIRIPKPACNGWYSTQRSWNDFYAKLNPVHENRHKIKVLAKVPA